MKSINHDKKLLIYLFYSSLSSLHKYIEAICEIFVGRFRFLLLSHMIGF